MALPAAIQAQLEQSDAIAHQLYMEQNPQEPEQSGNAESPSTPEDATGPTDIPFQDTAAPKAPAVPDTSGNDSAWEQRYKTLHGKYEAEVPRLHAELRDQRSLVQQLNQAVTHLTALPTAPEPRPEPKKSLVTQQDVDTFGGDLVDLIGRKAREIATEEAIALQTRVKDLEGQLGHTSQRVETSDNDRFYMHLGGAVPDYRAVNTDPRWLNWLKQTDPMTGNTRQQYLDVAASQRNVGRVASIFNAFKDTLQPVEVGETPQQELQRQVAPSKSNGGSRPQQPEQSGHKIWTSKDLNTHYTKARLGQVNTEDAKRIESEINRAMSEGRIRN